MVNVKTEKTKKIVLKNIVYDSSIRMFVDEDNNPIDINTLLEKVYGEEPFTMQTVLKESSEEVLDTDED